MAKTFLLEIVTPERILFSEEVASVIVPAFDGSLGVLAGHAPLLAALRPGEIIVRGDGGDRRFATSEGFVEVQPRKTVVLSESAERVEDINVEKTQKAREEAKERLRTAKGPDREEAEAALQRIEARLTAARKTRK